VSQVRINLLLWQSTPRLKNITLYLHINEAAYKTAENFHTELVINLN